MSSGKILSKKIKNGERKLEFFLLLLLLKSHSIKSICESKGSLMFTLLRIKYIINSKNKR